MPDNPRVGVQAFMDTKAFEKGMDIYTKGMQKIGQITDTVVKKVTDGLGTKLLIALFVFAAGVGVLRKVTGGLTSSMQSTNTIGLTLANTFGNILGNAFRDFLRWGRRVLDDFFRFVIKDSKELKEQLEDLKDAAIAPFVQALNTGQKIMGQLANRFREMIEEGGALHNVMINLGAAADLAVEGFGKLANRGLDGIENFMTKGASRFEQFIENALKWGRDVSIEFAVGLVEGATSALSYAMNFIGNLLESWLAPGSPPKVAPKLPEWGAGAMTEWLKGFAQADFGALKAIQSPLKAALDILVDTGKIGAQKGAELYVSLSKAIAQAVATGKVNEALFSKIAKSVGLFGKEIADLAKKELALAMAIKEVEESEKRLKELRKREQDLTDSARKQISEYNQALREGASKADLKARLDQINSTIDQRDATKEAANEEEDRLELAREQVEALREVARAQEELVRQLIELTRAQLIRPEDADEAGGSLVNRLGAAIDKAKEMLKEKFRELFAPFQEAYDERIKPVIDEFLVDWYVFTTILKQVWDEKVQPVIDAIREWFPDTTIERLGKFAGAVLAVAAGLYILGAAIAVVTSPIFLLAAGLVLLAALWEKYGEDIKNIPFEIWFIFWYYLNKISNETIPGWASETSTAIYNWIEDINTRFEKWGIDILNTIISWYWDMMEWINKFVADAIAALTNFFSFQWLVDLFSGAALPNWLKNLGIGGGGGGGNSSTGGEDNNNPTPVYYGGNTPNVAPVTNNKTVNVSIGDTTVNNDMDQAALQATVLRILGDAI